MEHHPTQEVKIEALPGNRPGVKTIKVHGPLTIHSFFWDFQELTKQESDAPVLLIDLTDVPYVDSAVVDSFAGIPVSGGKTGRKYALINPSERLQKLFSMTEVQQLLVTYDSIDAAEAALSR